MNIVSMCGVILIEFTLPSHHLLIFYFSIVTNCGSPYCIAMVALVHYMKVKPAHFTHWQLMA